MTPTRTHEVTEAQLRQQYAVTQLFALGLSYERAVANPAIRTSLACGARAAERAARNNPRHWQDDH